MARKPNYDQNKRRKEQDRKAKKDAKRLERQQRREQQPSDETGDVAQPMTESGEPTDVT
jgi:hypothetical protein